MIHKKQNNSADRRQSRPAETRGDAAGEWIVQVDEGKNIMTTKGTSPYSSQIPTPDTDVDNYTYIPSQQNIIPHSIKNSKVDTYTYIPSQECTIKSDKVNEAQRKYIPSQAAANIQKTYDNSGLQSALDRAQKAEDKALRVLAGNFEGM